MRLSVACPQHLNGCVCLCVKQDKVLKPRSHEVIHQISIQGSSSDRVVQVTVTLRPEPATGSIGSSTTLQAHTLLMHSQSTPIFPSLQGAWSNRQLENALPPLDGLRPPTQCTFLIGCTTNCTLYVPNSKLSMIY